MPRNCPFCAGELPTGARRGRPKTYCSAACRRSAELEIRRIDRRLAALEGSLSYERQSPLAGLTYDMTIAPIEEEIARQRKRLLELLSAGEAAQA